MTIVRPTLLFFAFVALVLLTMAGCSALPEEIGREPMMTPVGTGLVVDQVGSIGETVETDPAPSPGSTWRNRSATLFQDPRAVRPGDVLTVNISMKDKATLDSSSNRSRDSRRSLSGSIDFALDWLGITKSGDAEFNAKADGATSTQGKGATKRSESIDLQVAAVVTERLPNGNMVISGTQEVRVNYELRVLSVTGIVRPRDIAPDNTVSYDKIAEARISYGGRGRAMEVQQPGWGQQIIDNVSPF